MKLKLTAAAGLVVIGLAVAGVYLFFIRGDSPPPVSIEGAVSALSTPGRGQGTPAAVTTGGAPSRSLIGEWTISADGSSFVGYRVVEQLARIGTNTAVGRTTAVSGTMTYDGNAITKLEVTADLTKLRSDESLRDNQLRNQGIQTNTYPTATFVLAAPIQVGPPPPEGQTVTKTVEGDLTLHGVTKRISLEVQGQLKGGQVVVVGSTTIQFADYDIAQPRAASVLSIEDHGVMELQLIFSKAGA
jgi:polyisoprenoid-binding protein YceI